MKNTGKEYEELAQIIYQQILKLEGYNVEVKHNVKIQGKDYKHQIDVYWELNIAGITTKYLIEAKDYSSAVSIDKIKSFITTVNDIKNSHGIFIAKSGFQKGAKELAEKNGIQIYELRDINEDDFLGKMMCIDFEIKILRMHYNNLNLHVSKEKSKITSNQKIEVSGQTEIYQSGKKEKIENIIFNLCNSNGTNIKHKEYLLEENAYIDMNNEKIFVEKLSGDFGIIESKEHIKINGYEKIGKILLDVINKNYKIFDKDNNYIKDIS